MGLFGKKKNNDEETKETRVVESATSSSELKDLISEFRQMRAGINQNQEILDETHDVDHLSEHGEEYELSESDSQSIEDFLTASDEEEVDEEILDEEVIEEESTDYAEDEITEEEFSEDYVDQYDESEEEEFLDDEYDDIDEDDEDEVEDDDFIEEESPVDVDVKINEYNPEYEILNDKVEEIIEDESNSEDDWEVEEVVSAPPVDAVTNEELDRKFDEFENRLIEKLMKQFAQMQPIQPVAPLEPAVQAKQVVSMEDEELSISTNNGKLVINGYTYTGEVVMFTPLESVKKASWEDVVRRKGHCTYHLTTSGNGGWFIKKSNAPNPYAYIEKREDAEELAIAYAKREKAELKIHNAKGVIEKSLSFGREKLRG